MPLGGLVQQPVHVIRGMDTTLARRWEVGIPMAAASWVGGLAAISLVAVDQTIIAASRCPMFAGPNTHRFTSGIRLANLLTAILSETTYCRVSKKPTIKSNSADVIVPANAGILYPPLLIRMIMSSRVSKRPILDNSGPRCPP